MSEEQPRIVLLAGPNGAGKSTAAPSLLADTLQVMELVNADVIAHGLSAFHPERVALEAGRIMLQRLRNLASQRISFAFESTLAGRSFIPWIMNLRQTGYAFYLVYLWLPGPEMAITRVLERVRLGGHHVPTDTIRRRYVSGLRNFFQLYRPLADQWFFYDNSSSSGPRRLAFGKSDSEETILDAETWNAIIGGINQ
jgi:predicted ABC-type ATPase